MIFAVHANASYATVPIDALRCNVVSNDKKKPKLQPKRSCPFSLPGQTVFYRTFTDKTFGVIHACVVEVESYFEFVPQMVSSTELGLEPIIGEGNLAMI